MTEAVSNSITGYKIEMRSLQFLHFAFNKTQEITGMLSYQRIMLLHFGHADLGVKKDRPVTSLKPTTFKNDPQHNPNRKMIIKTISIQPPSSS
jgi:hypothetical protein